MRKVIYLSFVLLLMSICKNLTAQNANMLSLEASIRLLTPPIEMSTVESTFSNMGIPEVSETQYNPFEEFGGDGAAIDYCWGSGVDVDLNNNNKVYCGARFSLIFDDETKKTGSIKTIQMVASSKEWYDRFMNDVQVAGFKEDADLFEYYSSFNKDTRKAYSKPIDNEGVYSVVDQSKEGAYKVEIPFDYLEGDY